MVGASPMANGDALPLRKGLTVSLTVHGLLILGFTLKAFLVPEGNLSLESAVRVDLVALPDKIEITTPTTATATEPKHPDQRLIPADKEAPSVKTDSSKKQSDAIRKLKALEALEKIRNESKSQRPPKEVKFKGNILSPGTELTGLNKLQHEEYIGLLDRKIKQNWSLPEWMSSRNYQAQVRIRLNKQGRVLEKKIIKSSGNPSYDESVLETISKSEPFPAPPDKFVSILEVNGIIIGFPE